MVQVSLLGSQWRAFRGHKWNPLKERVDSLHSRPLSRLLTAVIFTLVVFLLPTTTVYYLVFLTVQHYICYGITTVITMLIQYRQIVFISIARCVFEFIVLTTH